MITKKGLSKLKDSQKEHILTALFSAKFKGAKAESGVKFKTKKGDEIRIATLLTFEEEDEIVKRIFVFLEESNDIISKFDIDEIIKITEKLEKLGEFKPKRDEFWAITNQKWTFEAYGYSSGKIALLGLDTVIRGIEKHYEGQNKFSRKLRDTLRHYGFD
ncbi:MAG: hypothetical protein R6U26_01460 [Candidatus Undinarchaeales archaeon]